MTRGLTGGRFADAEVGGRAYRLSEVGWAVYATDNTFYWVTSLEYGDFRPRRPPTCPTPARLSMASSASFRSTADRSPLVGRPVRSGVVRSSEPVPRVDGRLDGIRR